MNRNRRRFLSVFVTLALGLFLAYRISGEVRGIEWSEVSFPYLLLSLFFGVMAFLVYTFVWYLLLSGISEVGFRRLVLLNLMSSYVSMALNSTLGGIVKAKYAMSEWWKSIGVVGLVTTLEILPGAVVAVAFGDYSLLAGLLVLIWALVHEDSLYPLVALPFKLLGKEEWIHDFYLGWKEAKKGRFLEALLVAPFQSFFLALALVMTGRAFGISIPLWKGFVGVTYSTVIGGISGTPGGVGGNELGIMLAIGNVPAGATVAFAYKFLTQYVFALVGVVPFYMLSSGE
ncbi:hypothetical protein A3L09_09240 [Thermococcus profundus]|uniref:Uncharacterized protein n=1 Tax=Thermococcus profundus TaxID=49899 RepID=A0A2Z2MLX7_THEPR|nr:lysylphosphatidylglycerol synthase domain-containing protein [Thermococcus profundus]ASJ03431.1 hypothetical protein A3L09_09240 [Thermococcus profundus]